MDHKTSQWQRLEDLFAEAVELPPASRAAFVERETASDPELRSELLKLLHHDSGAGGRIAQAIGSAAEAAALPEEWTGKHFGPYRIVREIGRGGMGLVFLAVRDDDQVRKTVALKIAPRWQDLDLLRERFRHERQILAGLEHPNIARFLDGGTCDGIPYFAMEYVEGCPITEYASRHGLKLRDRIELFRQVCAAVQYAHQNLLVHRDLKPANILVSEDGQPKLLDFGIAKLLSPLPDTGENTLTGTAPWTPHYASPEQVRARPITTRTDIYSLGLILFELLTGERGQSADNSSPQALDRSICEVEVPRPSTRAPRALARQLAGDLDTIVGKATHKDPERRYGSVTELSDDLGRYLAGRPVRARKDSVVYRASKFLRRNWLPVGAASVASLSLIAGVIGFAWQARRAENRFNQVRKLANTVLFDINDKVANLAGSTPARQTIVRTSLEYLSSLSADAGNDATLQAELAEAYRRVGDVQGNPVGSSLGDAKGALESYGSAVDLYSRAARARPNDLALQNSFGQAFLQLAYRQYASADSVGANRSYAQAVRIFDTLLARNSSLPAALEGDAAAFAGLSRLLIDESDYRGAATQASKAVDISRRLLAADPSNPDRRDALAGSLNQLGSCLIRTGELDKAVDTYRSYVQLREQLVRDDPQNAVRRRSLMIAYSRLGEILGRRDMPNIGDFAGARIQFQRMLAIAESLAAADPANKTGQMDLSQAHMRMGGILRADEPKAALAHFRKALDLITQLAAVDSSTLVIQTSLGVLQGDIGASLASQGQLAEGIARMRKAMEIDRALLARQPNAAEPRITLLVAGADLARALARSRDRASVDALAAELSPLLEGLHSERFSSSVRARRPRTLFAFGEAYSTLQDRAQACEWFHRSVDAWREIESSSAVALYLRPLEADAARENAACLAEKK